MQFPNLSVPIDYTTGSYYFRGQKITGCLLEFLPGDFEWLVCWLWKL